MDKALTGIRIKSLIHNYQEYKTLTILCFAQSHEVTFLSSASTFAKRNDLSKMLTFHKEHFLKRVDEYHLLK